MNKYGNENGPTAEFLYSKYGSWEKVIEKINISFVEYDNESYVVFLKRKSDNLFMDFGLCGFETEMEYWDMPTKLIEFKGEPGFLFSNKIDRLELKDEIERFAKHNDI